MEHPITLKVEQVTFSYPAGVTALYGVSLTAAPGELIAIVGENGAGKTTLVRHLNGLLRPSEGNVWVGDWNTKEHTVAEMAHRVGYSFQNPDDQLFERTVRAEVAFGPRNLGFSPEAIESSVEAALSRVSLLEDADRHPYDLQLSQRKLLAMAATLAMRTPVVILDEPTTGQDGAGVKCIAEIVAGLRDEGRTLIAITHDMDFAAAYFDRVILMSGGSIVADGPTPAIMSQGDVLAAALVEPPQTVRLANALGIAGAPLTPVAFVDALAQRRTSLSEIGEGDVG